MNTHIIARLVIMTSLVVSACTKGTQAEGNAQSPASEESIAQAPSAPPTSARPNSAISVLPSALSVKVYKDPNCFCCTKWVEHLQQNGFKVESMDMPDLSMIKQKYAIGEEIQACHTAVVGDYAIEGHVPADLIMKMIREKPAIAGLAVPGMPMGSPGMEGATKERYDVLTFDRAGRTSVYAQR